MAAHDTPRSFMIRTTQDRVLRRNRRHLQRLPQDNLPPASSASPMPSRRAPGSRIQDVPPVAEAPTQETLSSYGRPVVKPIRFRDQNFVYK